MPCKTKAEEAMMTGDEIDQLLSQATISVSEYGEIARLGKNQAYKSVARGDVDAIRIGKLWRVLTAPLRQKLGRANQSAA
jgi:hypothetical protein